MGELGYERKCNHNSEFEINFDDREELCEILKNIFSTASVNNADWIYEIDSKVHDLTSA